MLASISDYLFNWQLPFILAFLVLWPVGGGLLLRRGVKKFTQLRKVRTPRCIGAALLAGLAGGVAGGILFMVLASVIDGNARFVVGLAFAMPAAAGLAYLVFYTMFGLSAKDTFKLGVLPLGGVLLLSAGLVAAVVPRAIKEHDAKAGMEMCRYQKLPQLAQRIIRYQKENGKPPESLQDLFKDGKMTKESAEKNGDIFDASCPGNPKKREVGYFYLKHVLNLLQLNTGTQPSDDKSLLLCDYGDNHGDRGRGVIFCDGQNQWYTEQDFQDLLKRPENQDFAKALQAAEGQ